MSRAYFSLLLLLGLGAALVVTSTSLSGKQQNKRNQELMKAHQEKMRKLREQLNRPVTDEEIQRMITDHMKAQAAACVANSRRNVSAGDLIGGLKILQEHNDYLQILGGLPVDVNGELTREIDVLLNQQVTETTDPLFLLAEFRLLRSTAEISKSKTKLQERCLALVYRWISTLTAQHRYQAAFEWLEFRKHVLKWADSSAIEFLPDLHLLAQKTAPAEQLRDLANKPLTLAQVRLWQAEKPIGGPASFVTDDHESCLVALAAVGKLRQLLTAEWSKKPDVKQIKQLVQDLREANKECVPVATRIQQHLAFRAFLAGYPNEARHLLPDDGSPEQMAAQLRDIEVLLDEDGELGTWAAGEAVSEEAHNSNAPVRGPPGLQLILPNQEGHEGGTVTVRESALEDLPPVEELAQITTVLNQQREIAETTLQKRVADYVSQQRAKYEPEISAFQQKLWRKRLCHARHHWEHSEALNQDGPGSIPGLTQSQEQMLASLSKPYLQNQLLTKKQFRQRMQDVAKLAELEKVTLQDIWRALGFHSKLTPAVEFHDCRTRGDALLRMTHVVFMVRFAKNRDISAPDQPAVPQAKLDHLLAQLKPLRTEEPTKAEIEVLEDMLRANLPEEEIRTLYLAKCDGSTP